MDGGTLGLRYTISIHAPTRGATLTFAIRQIWFVFQSTLPHGERQCHDALWVDTDDFNPRSHTGSDSKLHQQLFTEIVNIPQY